MVQVFVGVWLALNSALRSSGVLDEQEVSAGAKRIALAKPAAHQGWLGGNTLAHWSPNIALAQRVLSPVLNELMQPWLAEAPA